jgi:hypothetical protein
VRERRTACDGMEAAAPTVRAARTARVDARTRGSASRRSPRRRAQYLPRPREESRRARASRAAQAPDDPVRAIGLGKTSILRAGIVPRLRPEGYCPVYVRVDYSPSRRRRRADQAGDLRATQAAGAWTHPASPSTASRCGSSCTIATTCCATRPARR